MMSPMYYILLILGLIHFATQSHALPVRDSTSNTILLLMSSGNNTCNTASPFSNFTWDKVPELNALCNIQPPKVNQAKMLLNYNVVPALCMGIYEMSSILCNFTSKSLLFNNKDFPATPDEMSNLIGYISKEDEYVSLTKFCKSTIKNFTSDSIKDQSIDVGSKKWLPIIKSEIENESNCNHVCSTAERDKVHPLCSFIIWSYNIVAQPNYQRPKPVDGEMIPDVRDEKVNGLSAPSALAATERKMPAPTPDPKANLVTVSSDASVAVIPNERKGPAGIAGKEKVQAVDLVDTVPIPPHQTDLTTNKLNQSVSMSKVSLQNPGDKKVNANTVAKTDSSKTGLKFEEEAKPEIIKTPTKETTVAQPLAEENQNMDLQQPMLEDTGDKTPVEDKNPSQDNMEDEGAAGEGVFEPQKEEGDDDEDDDIIMQGDRQKPIGTNTNSVAASSGQKLVDMNPNSAGIVAYEKDRVETVLTDHFIETEDTHFFSYFLFMSLLTILAYLAFHNKNKLLALAVEGRRAKGTRRRPNSSNYSKLHCSLEEAMSSKSNASVTHVLY